MEPWEVAALLRTPDPKEKGAWERARIIAYITAQVFSSKKITPADVLPLPWDNDTTEGVSTPEQEAEAMARVREETKAFEEFLNKKNGSE